MSLALIHLGDSVPLYFRDCVHQLRLWNTPEALTIYAVLDPVHRGADFWRDIERTYAVRFVYTDELQPSAAHQAFRQSFQGDMAFRKGYWLHVQERFFFLEELMRQRGIGDMIAMEYDVLCYAAVDLLQERLRAYTQRLSFVMDNATRGHPGFMFVPSPDSLLSFLEFVVAKQIGSGRTESDMTLLARYVDECPDEVAFLPVITPDRNASRRPRQSLDEQHTESDPQFLSAGFLELGCLFDSAVVGQFVGGIDPRNTGGQKIVGYLNEGALYCIQEMPLGFARQAGTGLWFPVLDGKPLATIHMHSKALSCFLSDRPEFPVADYNVEAVTSTLEPN
jgi:hypothetical protein